MIEISKEKGNSLMQNAKIMYTIHSVSNKDIVGSVSILKTVDIIMYDIETLKCGKKNLANEYVESYS